MKKYLILFVALGALVTMFVSCTKDEAAQDSFVASSFLGFADVNASDTSATLCLDSVPIRLVKKSNQLVDITISNIHFDVRMPKINMKISSVSYTVTAGDTLFSANSIVPTSNGVAFPNFIVTNLQGRIFDDRIDLNMLCGTSRLYVSGSYVDRQNMPQ